MCADDAKESRREAEVRRDYELMRYFAAREYGADVVAEIAYAAARVAHYASMGLDPFELRFDSAYGSPYDTELDDAERGFIKAKERAALMVRGMRFMRLE